MAAPTDAERLRLLIAAEEELNPFPGEMPNTFDAVRIFLESVHQHQLPVLLISGKNSCRCWVCGTVRLMIQEF